MGAGERGRRLGPESRRVLDFIEANPGVLYAGLLEAFRRSAIDVDNKLYALVTGGYVEGRPILARGKRRNAYFALRAADAPAAPRREAVLGPIAQPRDYDIRAPWPEPYLTDAGVRRSGLEYRDCASRRGNHFVYCYRKEAA